MTLKLNLPSSASYDFRRRWLGSRPYWCCQILGWGGLLLLQAGPLPFKPRASGAEVLALFFFSVSGLGLSHLLRLGILWSVDASLSWLGLLFRILPWVLGTASIHVLAQIGWARDVFPHQSTLFNTRPGQDPLLLTFTDTLSLSAGVFIVWAGAYFGLRIYRQYQASRIERLELAANVQEAAWQALRAQLNPHLLFNSLNSIRALIPQEQQAPRTALTHLSELLRSSLSLKQDELIPLNRELETVESFLALERLRFEQRLRVSRSIAPEARDWLVPPFLVQLLVENAVKYGVAPFEEGGDVALDIRIEDQTLLIEVRNRGSLAKSDSGQSTGLGLANARSRLALIFGHEASLSLESAGPELVRARALVPRRRQIQNPTIKPSL